MKSNFDQSLVRHIIRSSIWGTVLLVLMQVPCVGASPAAKIVISVDAATAGAPFRLALGAQLDGFSFFASLPGGAARLQALSPKWFRIHAGSDGSPAVLPEPLPVETTAAYDFGELNNLVTLAYQSGGTPVLNVRYAPRTMWTCRTYFSGQNGSLIDPTFNAFGNYLARLVSYYNKGTMSDGKLTRKNPFATRHRVVYWEIWNEPDLSNETPCISAGSGPALTSNQYLKMWKTVTAKMSAVDSSVKFIGPTVSYAQTGQSPEYIPSLLSAAAKPAAISMHAYGGTQTLTDNVLLNGDGNGSVGVPSVTQAVTIASSWVKNANATAPIWLDETNLEYDWSDDPKSRPWTAFGAAFDATVFARIARIASRSPTPVAIFPFQLVESGFEQSELNPHTGVPLLNYWTYQQISRCFGAASRLVPATSTNPNIETIAARNGTAITVLVVNPQPAAPSDKGGSGVPRTVMVHARGLRSIRTVSLTMIDARTPLASGPPVTWLPARTDATVSFAGYGVAFLTFSQ